MRWLEQQVKFLLSNPLGVIVQPKRVSGPLAPDSVKSVLILRYDALGDAVLSSPVWHSIRKYMPNARIGVVGSRRNEMLLRSDPQIDDVFVFSKALTLSIIPDLFRARRTKWDLVLNISFHDKTRAAIYSRIVAPNAVTVTAVRDHREKYERLYSIVGERAGHSTPILLQWLNVLKDGLDLPLTYEDSLPRVYADPAIAKSFGAELARGLSHAGQTKYIIINTDAAEAFREWGFENTLELSRRIANEWRDLQIFWTSAPQRSSAAMEFLASQPKHPVIYLNTPSVQHLLVAVEGASAVISPDTSVVHIASAYRKPTLGLYVEHNEYPIYGTLSRMVFAPDGKLATSIGVDAVLSAFRELMAEQSEAVAQSNAVI